MLGTALVGHCGLIDLKLGKEFCGCNTRILAFYHVVHDTGAYPTDVIFYRMFYFSPYISILVNSSTHPNCVEVVTALPLYLQNLNGCKKNVNFLLKSLRRSTKNSINGFYKRFFHQTSASDYDLSHGVRIQIARIASYYLGKNSTYP